MQALTEVVSHLPVLMSDIAILRHESAYHLPVGGKKQFRRPVGGEKQFRRRILLVDDDNDFLEACSHMFRKHGYDVLTTKDGFAALCALRGGIPDLLITDLDLPRLSGFELLSIVRCRFPMIAVLVVSDDYSATTLPHEVICDAFLPKSANLDFELLEEARNLISASPLRGSRSKADTAPVWIPRSKAGYIVLTCPECLRSFSAIQPSKAGTVRETCLCCGADIPFEMSSIEVQPAEAPQSVQARSHSIRAMSRQLREEHRRLRDKSL